MEVFEIKNFGAKGDGITNDAVAFWNALDAVKNGGILQLEKNKTYYIAKTNVEDNENIVASGAISSGGSKNRVAAIDLNNAENVIIRGENSTILIDNPLFYCNINYTKNVTLDGLNFDYKVRPFVLGKLVKILDDRRVLVKTDRKIAIKGETKVRDFGVLQRPDGRYHMFMSTITPVDDDNTYEILFSDNELTKERISMLEEYDLIVPVPNFAHTVERAFSITNNSDFTMKNCNVYSMARFGFALFCNDGIMEFNNVKIIKAEDELATIVGWRDCFHVKENHAKFIWKNCYAEYCYDDIFNISASTLNVNEVISETELDLAWKETNGIYPGIRVGDTVSFINIDTGHDYGESVISEIVERKASHNHFKFKTPIKNIEAGDNVKAHVLDMVSPGSEIINCDFRGTFRFRGPVTIENSYLYVVRMWIDMFMPYEGPVPKHIHFKNCEIVCDDEVNPYFHIVAQKESSTGENQYHIEDVVFENCKLPVNTFDISADDKKYIEFK